MCLCQHGGKIIKYKKIATTLAAIALLAYLAYTFIGNPVVFTNNKKLQQSISSITSESTLLNELVPFIWDAVYTFEPYTSKEQIEEILGFKSASIKANNINEGMVHLLFVRNNKVVSSILGYGESLGYRLDFSEKILFADNAVFSVIKTNGVVVLTYLKPQY